MRRLRIACDLEMRPAVHYASDSEAEQRLRGEFEMRTNAGFDAKWLGPRVLRETTGITGLAAIRTSANAQFDPWKACCGVVGTAVANGTRVFEHSRVTRIVQTRSGVRLHTKTGRVDAARVVIATGYATPYFRPLAGKFRLFHTYVLATKPLNERQRREVGLSRVMTWDTARPYHYSRWTADNRLLLGGGDRPVRSGQWRDYRRARDLQDLRDHFERPWPALADLHISTAWEGLFATTPASLPYIGPHARYPNHLFALGYGGNGMTFSFLAARMLLEQWHGVKSPDHRLFRFARVR
jgi:glycine/D-amino acid oxidase-like deaminating enzyme